MPSTREGDDRTRYIVRAALAIAPRQPVSVRIRDIDRLVDAEVIEAGECPRLRIHSVVAGLHEPHFTGGVDISTFYSGERYVLDGVEVESFDRDRRILTLIGPVNLRHVRRRTNYREPVQLPVRIGRFRGSSLAQAAQQPIADGIDGVSLDIGGGGLSAESTEAIPVYAGQNALLEIDVDGFKVMAVARTAWSRTRNDGVNEVGFAFLQVDDQGHDRLYRYLYELQRRRMR